MKTEIIKKMISKAVENEKSTNSLAKLVKTVALQNGKSMTLLEAQRVSDFVIEYVKLVPVYIEEGLDAAGKFGIQNEMSQMISELEHYWIIEQDLIPDNLGLIGITDDAYASIYLLQTLSDYCKSINSRPLLQTDFTNPNKVIRNLLGDSIAIAIEQKVQITIASNMTNQIFNQLYQNIFSSGFTFGNAAQAYIDQREIDDHVNVQLGAMGIF